MKTHIVNKTVEMLCSEKYDKCILKHTLHNDENLTCLTYQYCNLISIGFIWLHLYIFVQELVLLCAPVLFFNAMSEQYVM
jgi:hypothetical protein